MNLRVSSFVSLFVLVVAALACSSTNSSKNDDDNNSSTPDAGGDGATTDPGSTSLAAECVEGGAGVTKDGWTRVIGGDFVTAKSGDVLVAIVYALTIDDELRAASHFAEGVWDRLLGADFTPGARTSGGDRAGELAFSSGTATEIATGAKVFITVTADRSNGVAFPVIAIAPDEATLTGALPTQTSVSEMRRYNYFPLSCTGIVGTWSTSSLTAVDTNAGVKVSSLRLDLILDAASTYTLDAKVSTNEGSEQETDTGSYTSAQQEIALTSKAGFRNKTYDAGFVAVRGGVGLYIVDREFSGDAWLLFRTK
ncbi:MAG: hypothetical protein KF819_40760 [Labilithrix sp.]|nr:hypothetical protein [Labilithrix sp.]